MGSGGGEKGALRGNFPVEGGSGKQLAGWSEGEGFPLLNVVRFKCLTRVNPINGDITLQKNHLSLSLHESVHASSPSTLTGAFSLWLVLLQTGAFRKTPYPEVFPSRGESGL